MTNRIVNVKSGAPYDIYCGRSNATYKLSASKWANPFIIGRDGTRDEVIEKFRLYINSDRNLLLALYQLKGKSLGCWCNYPHESCHCEVLIELSESKNIKNWFSNMLPFERPMLYQGMLFAAPENFYQAMKLPKQETHLRRQISKMTPFEAKTAIRDKSKYLWREDWTPEFGLQVMRRALEYKFQEGTDWRRKLLITKELGLELVEWNSWGDIFWGRDVFTGEGENHLGKILMEIRDKS